MDTNTRVSTTSFRWQMNTDGPETYEQYIVLTWMADWTPDLITAGSIGPETRVLDVACGTGIVARMASEIHGKNGRFTGIDINEGMLRHAKRYAAEKGVNCGFYQGNAARMPFSSGVFDTVVCQQGLQFFSDRSAALQEMNRVLAPGGTLALSVWGRAENSPHVGAICEAFTTFLGEDSTTMFRVACSLSDPWILQRLVEDAGFSNIQIKTGVKTARHPSISEFLPAYFSIFPVAAQITAMSDEDRTRMFRSIERTLEPWMENEGIAVPTENCILTAHK